MFMFNNDDDDDDNLPEDKIDIMVPREAPP